jgi:hypothetical protein
MTSLRATLNDLAQSFADSILDAIRSASLDDLVSESGVRPSGGVARGPAQAPARDEEGGAPRGRPSQQRPGRLPRRSEEDIAKAVDLVSKLVKSHPKGLRSEEIRKLLGLDAREMPRILKDALAQKKLKSRGQKRATTYFAP